MEGFLEKILIGNFGILPSNLFNKLLPSKIIQNFYWNYLKKFENENGIYKTQTFEFLGARLQFSLQ